MGTQPRPSHTAVITSMVHGVCTKPLTPVSPSAAHACCALVLQFGRSVQQKLLTPTEPCGQMSNSSQALVQASLSTALASSHSSAPAWTNPSPQSATSHPVTHS